LESESPGRGLELAMAFVADDPVEPAQEIGVQPAGIHGRQV
jgi:hypothetical protein